jgi:septal ring-binding cell division protein DamX
MDQQGLRDVDRWKDKIEVRLDNRQVAFLFFGSALVACMLFILGVIVGKRLESRGRALAPEIEDPLALLDRVAATTPPAPPPAAVAPAVIEDDPMEAPGPAVRPAAPKPVEKLAEKPADKPAPKPAEKAAEKAVDKPIPPVEAKTEAKAEARSADILPPSFEAKDATKDATKKPRFMLQVGSFPDKAEAEAYASTFASERPIVVMSEIPGKGTWYRVRLGGFQAFKEAVDAKTVFERRYNKIALVVGPL